MVRFQYDHNIGQWRWHISKNAEKTDEKILDTLRGAVGGNEFTYASVGADEFVCMSSLPADGGSILQGTVVGVKGKLNDLPQKPCCYVGKWGKYDLLPGEEIPEGELPAPDTTADYDYFPAQLGQILDAVMFGNKKVAIIVESNDEAMDCIKAINYMLPPAYAKRIGYSVGAGRIPDTNLSIMTDAGKTIPIGVKVFFTEAGKVDPSAQGYYVFDINPESPTNNYRAELSEFARLVNDFCMDSQAQMDIITQRIAGAFDADGNLDRDMLKRLSLLLRFKANPDDKTAESLVDVGMGNGTDKVQKMAFLSASQHFWRHSNPTLLSEKLRQNMVAAYRVAMGPFSESDSVEYFQYLLNQESLTQAEKDVLVDIAVTRDCLAENCGVLFCNPDFGVRNTVFEILTQMLLKDANVYSREALIKGAVAYFDINNCFAVLNSTGEYERGEKLFSLAGQVADKEVRPLLLAILMASCFTTTASAYSPHTPIRFKGIRRMITEAKLSTFEQIEYVVQIQHKMDEIASLDDFGMNDIAHFLCDRGNKDEEPEWTKWIRDTVNSLSMSQLLALERVLIKSDYIGLKEIVEGKLLNLEYVAPELRRNEDIRPEYKSIFNMLNYDHQYKRIDKYLVTLEKEKIIEAKFLEERWSFLKDAYETLSDSDKRKVGEMPEEADELRPDKRNAMADRVQAEFRGAGTKKGGLLFSALLPIANTALWAVVAFAAMLACTSIIGNTFMAGHSTLVAKFMLLPILSAAASALFYVYNAGRNFLFRNIVTAVETVTFLVTMLLAFYGSMTILGFIL